MPAPIAVDLVPYDPNWANTAQLEAERLGKALGANLLCVHHVGSTAIPGIIAKPVIDLVPEVASLEALDAARDQLEALGYEYWGEYGLPGRRYCNLDDPISGKRLFQLHCYLKGSAEITRHLAFRNYMRAHPEIAARYADEKRRCRDLHPNDSHAYSDCKSNWIRAMQQEALAANGSHHRS